MCAPIILLYLCIDILRRFDNMVESVIPQLPTSFEDVTDPDGKSALIWILGEYGEVQVYMFNIKSSSKIMVMYMWLHVRFTKA